MRRAAAFAAVLLALATPMVRSGATRASAAPVVAAGTEMTLVAQDAWDVVGTELGLELRVPAALATPDSLIRLVAYQPVTSRAAFDRITDGAAPNSVFDQVVLPLSALPAGATGSRSVTVGLEAPDDPRDPDRLSLRQAGVYPLAIELRDGNDRTQSSFVTMAVVVAAGAFGGAAPLTQRLGVAWVWPLEAGPSTRPDGSNDPAVTAELRPQGRLGRQAEALTRAGDVPLTLAPGPETLEAWVAQGRDDPAIARGANALIDASGRFQVISGTYVPTNLPSLLAGGLVSAVDGQLAGGSDALSGLLSTPVDTRTALARPIDGASLARLRAGGADRVIIDDSSVVAPSGRPPVTRPLTLQPSLNPDGPVAALESDTGIAQLLGGNTAPALRAQLVLAALSVVAQEEPEAARAVAFTNPVGLDAPTSLFDAILTGLRGHPWLQAETTADVFANVPSESSRDLADYSPPAPPVGALVYELTRSRLTAFRSLAGSDDPAVVAGERSLLLSESATFAGPAGEFRASATIASVGVSIDAFLARIRVPRPSTITLTSRSGEIPLTFRNDTGKSVDVLIELFSPKLYFPEGSSRLVTLDPKSTTVRFAVEALTSGTFPLRLSVRSADGVLAVADTQFHVRSTVVSTVGFALMAGAVAVLVLWWGIHIRRTRRARRAEVESA